MDLLIKASQPRERKNFTMLPVGTYQILKCKWVKTQFGNSVVATTKDFDIFLPKRITEDMTEEKVNQTNEDLKTSMLMMTYNGTDKNTKSAKVILEKIDTSLDNYIME